MKLSKATVSGLFFAYLNHTGGCFVVLGDGMLIYGHGDKLYRLGEHFRSHIMLLYDARDEKRRLTK